MRWLWQVDDTELRADRAILNAIENERGTWLETPEGKPLACSRSRLQKLFEERAVLLDGVPLVKTNVKLSAGSQIEILFPVPKKLDVLPEDKPIEILYQDEHLLIVNKPPGLTVHPSDTQTDGTLVNILLHHIKDLSGIGGMLRPGIVHRLDKDTSGALVITKTDQAHQRLVETFSRHDIERVYWALVYGAPKNLSGTIEGNIGRSTSDRKKMALLKTGGRKAVSHYQVLTEFRFRVASWLEVTLETGRTHQIRVHLTSIGHSVLGDPVYGTPTENQTKWKELPEAVRKAIGYLPGQALHARVLGFIHPVSGEKIRVEADPPKGFSNLLETLQKAI